MSNKYVPAYVAAYSDSSFTNPHDVALPNDPPDCKGTFTHMGAKYWGFETARHKATTLNADKSGFRFDHNAHHWLKLGLVTPAIVKEIQISTRWFTGNQVLSIAVILFREGVPIEILKRSPLKPDSEHSFRIKPTEADECLVRCFHEGGIARINLMGQLLSEEPRANILEDAVISHVSNEHYGKPKDAVEGNRDVGYMLGWESARTGFGEQALFHLKNPAIIQEIVVDTYMHRLNSPLSCHAFGIEAAEQIELENAMTKQPKWSIKFDSGEERTPEVFQTYMQEQRYLDEPVANPEIFTIELKNHSPDIWRPLISFAFLRPDQYHRFRELESNISISHLLYMHYPNGGIHGLKAFGNNEQTD